MNEWVLQWLAFSKLIAVAIFGLLYGIGGMWRKWVRRYVGPFFFGLCLWFFSNLQGRFNWWYILTPLLLMGALHKGYSNNEGQGLKKRLLCALLLSISGLPIAIVTGNWILFGVHTLLCFTAMVIFGVTNPMRSARDEETAIGALSVLMPLFMC